MPKDPKNFKDVQYYIPGRKRPVAGSSKATNDFLVAVHELYPKATIAELRDILTDRSQWIFNPETVEVLDAHIKVGAGNRVPDWR